MGDTAPPDRVGGGGKPCFGVALGDVLAEELDKAPVGRRAGG
jgi:hypothetical protein